MCSETEVVDKVPKTFGSDLALAYVGMTINPGAEVGLGVIQMERNDTLQTDQGNGTGDCLIPAGRSPDIIPSSEEVRRIDADREPGFGLHSLNDGCQVFQTLSEATPLPRSILERDSNRRSFCGLKDLIKRPHDAFDPEWFSGAQMGSGMQHEKWQLQAGGKLNFLDQ